MMRDEGHSEGLEDRSPVDDLTIQQSGEEMAASVALSRQEIEQSASAPRVAGYALQALLGEGAYGQVWRGVQMRTNKEVAVKVFMQRGGLDWIFLQREVERLTRLDRHPHVVTLLDTDLGSEPPFYAMDLIGGGSLARYVKEGAVASEDRAVGWMEQIGQALAYVHGKGLIHCDLKPANILVDDQNNVRVVDFGQSRVFTESSASLGTLYYMAPEQARRVGPGDPVQPDVRWDVYALGATIHAILFGRPPRATAETDRRLGEAEDLGERLARYREIVTADLRTETRGHRGGGIDSDLMAVISKCVAPRPEDRYDAVAGVLADLEAMRRKQPVSPLAGSRAYRTKKFIQRNPFRIGLVVATVVLLVSLYVTWQQQGAAYAARAQNVLASFDYAPGEAYANMVSAGGRFNEHLVRRCREYLSSPSSSLRVMGARGSPIVCPEAFWRSVDGGKLWAHGEWLELLEVEWPETGWLVDMLAEKAAGGSDREQYVAFCLIGQMAGDGGIPPDRVSALKARCVAAVGSESWPGVVSAARWAARRLGEDVAYRTGGSVFVDEVSGLSFARIPPTGAFRRGASARDRDRYEDEARVDTPVAVGGLFMSTTEVTVSAFEPFLNSQSSRLGKNWLTSSDGKPVRGDLLNRFRDLTIDAKDRAAANRICLNAARAYCAWLNDRAKGGVRRVYRLPTEDEWEYACRGGNSGRYCFGDDSMYAPRFANCNGELHGHEVGGRMPNWYGLFDMHGGLWELCDSRYEERYVTEPDAVGRELYVFRGGSYLNPAVRCRSTQRNRGMAQYTDYYRGFRLVMEKEEE